MEIARHDLVQVRDKPKSYIITDLIQIGKQLGEATKLHTANVHITDLEGNRSKRHELLISRDLEYLRIHDSRNGRTIASYPDAAPYFHMCAPHCLLVKQKDGRIRRLLWQAIGPESIHDEDEEMNRATTVALLKQRSFVGQWLRCKVDWVGKDGASIEESIQPGGVPTDGSVSHLESMVVDGKVFLLAGYRNGLVACYTEDLRTANSPLGGVMLGEELRFMTSVSSSRAKGGILGSNSNIHSMLDGSRLLVTISKLPDSELQQARVRVFQFSTKASSPNKPFATVLMSQDITLPSDMLGEIGCSVDDKGQLCIWTGPIMQVFDLSKNSSQPYRTLRFKNHIISMLRIDHKQIAVCTTHNFSLINLEFSAPQGEFSWPEPLAQSHFTKTYNSALCSYEKRTARLLCLYESKIFSIILDQKSAWTLADFMSQDLNQSELTKQYQEEAQEAYHKKTPHGGLWWSEWPSIMTSLRKCHEEQDEAGFDTIFKAILVFITGCSENAKMKDITLSPSQQLTNDEKLSFVISKIFALHVDPTVEHCGFDLDIKILPQETFHWLVRNDLMIPARITHCFKKVNGIRSEESVFQTAVIRALQKYDPSLTQLKYFVRASRVLSAEEASMTLTCAMTTKNQGDLPNAARQVAGDDMEIDHPLQTSLMQHGSSTQSNQNESDEKAELIRIALLRLLAYDTATISNTIQKQMSQDQLFFLINFLRLEMSQQGWFAEVLQGNAFANASDGQTQTISQLVKILGCILDTLGMAPWLNSATSSESENLITWMKLEISAALEAVEEASFMSGILHEAGLFTKLLETKNQQQSRSIETVVTETGAIGANALPLGLKPAGYLDIEVVRHGKVEKMSKRQIMYEKNKTAGIYSHENIRL